MALNSESPKHEEGTFSVEGRVPGRVGEEKKNLYKGLFEIVLMESAATRSVQRSHKFYGMIHCLLIDRRKPELSFLGLLFLEL